MDRISVILQVDLIRTVTLPHLEPFGISDGLELRVRALTLIKFATSDLLRSKNAVLRHSVVVRFSLFAPL
jgi:hypothetical protein